ncbi:hypothetical protein [Elioraea tepidiphila]|uniref:PIN-like domain-containing protein n=1 Tax=Elioraea tepidiphila TaxID=457934 RepID=UPI002FDAFB6F
MKLYFDRTQSPRLARIAAEVLAHGGHGCDWSRNRYPDRDPGDVQWMKDLAAEGGWVVVTGDERIIRNPAERAVWRASGLTTFFLCRLGCGHRWRIRRGGCCGGCRASSNWQRPSARAPG